MPVYEYECKACHREFEYQQRMSDPEKTVCEACGGALDRLISRTAFQLKGGGWYKDLYSSSKPESIKADAPKADAPAAKTESAGSESSTKSTESSGSGSSSSGSSGSGGSSGGSSSSGGSTTKPASSGAA